MKKFCLSALLAAVLMLPGFAQAESTGVYVAPKLMLSVQHAEGELSALGYDLGSEDKTSSEFGGAFAVGYDFSRKFDVPVRAELEFAVTGATSKDVDAYGVPAEVEVGAKTLLANVYWDICEYKGFTPYVGAGIGFAFVNTEASALGYSIDDSKTVFAGQVGFGCAYAITDSVAVDLGYRFLMMGNGEVEYMDAKLESKDITAHQFMLGLRVTF